MTRTEVIDYIRANHPALTPLSLAEATGVSVKAVCGVLSQRNRSRRAHPPELIKAVCDARGTASRHAVAEQFSLTAEAVTSIWHRYITGRKSEAEIVALKPIEPVVIEPARRPGLSDLLGIRSVPGYGGISVPRVSILHGHSPPSGG